MSKAFTKDDGPDAPAILRRRPPLAEGVPNYVTPRGLAALRDELAALEPSAALQPGHETLAARRAELEQRIATAVMAPPPADHGEVRFGARVRVRDEAGERQLQIVGVDEAHPGAGTIAFVAPLARALLGRRVGDLVTVQTPGGEEELVVLAIAYDGEGRATS